MPFPDEIKPVIVVDYQPGWPAEFERLATPLRQALGNLAISIDHIGSTSVLGLAAKDVIDIQVTVAALDMSAILIAMSRLGYRPRPEPWNRIETVGGATYPKMVFAPPAGARACNIHFRQHASVNARFALLFRDYLRSDPNARAAWATFKMRLAATVKDLADYGQIKAPATDLLMQSAERWALATRWEPWAASAI